jgi:hypothetical protein
MWCGRERTCELEAGEFEGRGKHTEGKEDAVWVVSAERGYSTQEVLFLEMSDGITLSKPFSNPLSQ